MTKPVNLHADTLIKKQLAHQVLHADSAAIQLRHFNANALSRYQSDPAFNYHNERINSGATWWDRFWTWLWHLIENLFGKASPADAQHPAPYTKYIVLTILIGILIYVLVNYIGKDLAGIFNRKSTSVPLSNTEVLENIHEINFDDRIDQAIQQQNYKLAVRLLYLRTLKQLSDAQLIHWKLEKTNSAYLQELNNADQKRVFTALTYQFEYIWYGDFPVNRLTFQNIYNSFQDFKNLVP